MIFGLVRQAVRRFSYRFRVSHKPGSLFRYGSFRVVLRKIVCISLGPLLLQCINIPYLQCDSIVGAVSEKVLLGKTQTLTITFMSNTITIESQENRES